ncbi:MAG: inorganic diphosphatase, partial [Patescibacteria group bacterium]|nr:inorganic diphosphatase [Patescibacteria group bacterium]
DDRRWDDYNDLSDLNAHTLKEIQHFFETYKLLKGKGSEVAVHAFKGKEDALSAFEHGKELYRKTYGK